MNDNIEPEFINPPQNLKSKVDFNDNGIDMAALEKVEEGINKIVVEKLSVDYMETAVKDVEKLQALYNEANSSDDKIKDNFKKMFDVVHDMKGQGGSFGYDLVSSLCDSFCHVLEKVENPSVKHLVLIKLHIDAVQFVLAKEMTGKGGKDGAQMLEGIKAVVAKVLKS
ncbi:MAG: Hpt domain-containing protein [Alphaproteobacteria bacterium]|nr:Hpt domain-containing protein [Alphaproteobacteria bacterium]